MQKLVFIILIMASPATFFAQQKIVSILSYGAKADGTLNTSSIQKAIDDVASGGGGTVVIPPGEFVTGSVLLKSGVNLHLQAGAVLAGSDKRKDYEIYKKPALIIAIEQHDISITGSGIIDGREER